jgi:hypothetical protein
MSNTYIKENLILEFDTNDINVNDLSLISKRKWDSTKVISNELKDYGLNQYDIGLTIDLKEEKTINNEYLTLERIGESFLNSVDYSNYQLSIENFPTIGKVLMSSGGYLNNPFKYHGYDIEYLPRQFNEGFTFETTLFVNDLTFSGITDNSNIFLYLGLRAEDKFADSYTGNTVYFTKEGATLDNSYRIYDLSNLPENTQNITTVTTALTTLKLYIKSNGQTDFVVNDLISDEIKLIYNSTLLIKDINYTIDLRSKTISLINISTVSTDELYLNYYKLIDDVNLVNIDLSKINNYTTDLEYNVENNVIAFKFDKNGRIGYRKINENRKIEQVYSEEQAVYNGWNHIVITFKPDSINTTNIETDEDCSINSRNGTISIFVNGIEYLKKTNFIEPIFNAFPIDKSKQIGVPYNLSWGGGSPGLKNSLNFNGIDTDIPYQNNSINNNLLIQKNFDGYFKGGFNKLRIYNKFFTISDVKTNYLFESEYYNINYNKGGRIIQINNFVPMINIIQNFEVYWSKLFDNVDYLNTDLTTLNKITLTSDSNIIINNINLDDEYLLIVTTSTISDKTKWYIDVLNNGDIGGISNLFGNITTSGNYKYYITNYQTTLNSIILKK